MRSQIYLVLIRDGRLALTVGAALEDRLRRDGRDAMALVPAVRGPEFADSDCRRVLPGWRSGSGPAGHGPQVVALYEDGLLDDLASLGLRAYVGVRHGEQPRIARWADDCGAIMLPVETARDLVDAVADHTPWSRYAAGLPSARYPVGAKVMPVVRHLRPSSHGSPVLSHKVAPHKIATVATVAGPLLLAGLPSAAIAVGGSTPVPMLAAAASGGTVAAVDTADTQPAPPPAAAPVPIPPTNAGTTPSTSSKSFTNPGTGIQNHANATVTGAGHFPGRSDDAFRNYVPQSAQGNITFWNTLAQDYAAAVQADASWGGFANDFAQGLTTSSAGRGTQQAALHYVQSSPPSPSGPPWSGSATANSAVRPRAAAAGGGGGGGGGAADTAGFPRNFVATLPTPQNIRVAPIASGTPVTTLPRIPMQRQLAPDPMVNDPSQPDGGSTAPSWYHPGEATPPGDNPGDALPPGDYNPGGPMQLADGSTPPGAGSSPSGRGDTAMPAAAPAAVPPPTATPVTRSPVTRQPVSVGGTTVMTASAGGLTGGTGGAEGGGAEGGGAEGGGVVDSGTADS